MWINYLKISARSLFKDKKHTLINLIGLSLGLATTILIVLFVKSEWTFDHFHTNKNEIHRLWVKEFVEGDVFFNTETPLVMGDALKENFGETRKLSRYLRETLLLNLEDRNELELVHYAEPEFFDIFDFAFSNGSPRLDDPSQIVITEKKALEYFGYTNAVGKTLAVRMNDEWREFTISGIIEAIPQNSSIQFDFLLPYATYLQRFSSGTPRCWTCVFGETYVLLPEGLSGDQMQTKTAGFFNDQVKDQYEAGKYIVGFQPLLDIHLNRDFPVGIVSVSDARYPYILSAIAVLILLLAGINYVSLSIGKSLNRSKEVGIRKVIGAKYRQILLQHLGEALFMTLFAGVFGFMLASVLLPLFNQLFNQQLVFQWSGSLIGIMLVVSIVLAFASAIYPSIVVSGFQPIKVLSGRANSKLAGKQNILRWLTSSQFFLSIVLVICTLTMRKQINYMINQNLGFHKEATLVVPKSFEGSFSEQIAESRRIHQLLSNDLASNDLVKLVSTSNHAFGASGWMRAGFYEEGADRFRSFRINGIDHLFIPLYDIQLLSGENFKENQDFNQNAVIVNQKFLDEFGIANAESAFMPKPFDQFRIVGTVDNFHYASMHTEIEPLVFAYDPLPILQTAPDLVFSDPPTPVYNFRLAGSGIQESVAAIRSSWKKLNPNDPFSFTFVEDNLNTLYDSEIRLNNIVFASSVIAIIIAALGLYGIIGISTRQRRKEIGIRKVLGANLSSLVALIARDFVFVLSIALTVAIPVGWLVMKTLA